ncbi:protein FAR1-RELATED SEQUENCE 5-like isoform X1 [Pistacia vera]|uniref:protein FAR1-RELATED SEQUENCE 5-like isoform X1 n=1 Tax=Pistacia vera TaxID=55513 RepID=UPI001262D966|nr:protein FAR1-RELATED SEQUENCE 5-like isoform X1 [Pistacia vera]XP_031270271.1 protein FAR1-RELATED SEQUENCE 5-like isoform X1 [Pistacia vera]
MEFEPLDIGNETIEFDQMGNSDGEDDLEQPQYYDHFLQNNDNSTPDNSFATSDGDLNLEPYEGMEFDSEQAARIFYNSYARRVGFSTRVSVYQRSRRDGSIICRQIVCSREGFRREGSENRSKRQRTVTRVGCKAQMTVKKQSSGKWTVSKLVKEHNHELVPPDKVHCLRSHRHVSGPARSLIDTLQAAGMGPSGVMSVLIKESGGVNNVGFTKVDCQNYMSSSRQRTLGSGGQVVIDYLKQMQAEDPGFFCSFQGNFENSSGNIFWADANSRMNYNYFGDTVTFDTTYRTNRYRVPFAPFTGWNHHGQPVLIGCALLLNESEASFIWLFEAWLAAMSGRHPVSITTDQDRIIRSAVAHVFPGARHRFCKWNVFREAQEKLSDVYHSQPNFEVEFQRCINLVETVDEFESCWESLLQRYNLGDNEWLQSMYNVRQQWVPVYLRDTFFGEMSISQGSDNINSYFDGYINASTHIQVLIKQYEKAVATRYEREVKADYDTVNTEPVLKTPSPMEKQVANLYTRKIFMKFQEELVETLAYPATIIDDTGTEIIYRVAKFGEDHKTHFVRFNVFEKKASCSCQMFEFSGIICRHILAVFRVTNVLTLPSHYILKRWTRNAKSGVLLNDHILGMPGNAQESSAARHDNLRLEVIKYVEQGAQSTHSYNVAMDALREATKKVAAAKKHGPGVQQNTLFDGSQQLQSCSVDQDKRIQELTVELENASQQCEAYRTKLMAVLKDTEEQKLKMLVKVQNVRLNLKV